MKIKRFSSKYNYRNVPSDVFDSYHDIDVKKTINGEKFGRTFVGGLAGLGVGLIPAISSSSRNKISKKHLAIMGLGTTVGGMIGKKNGDKEERRIRQKSQKIKELYKKSSRKDRDRILDKVLYVSPDKINEGMDLILNERK